MGRYRRYLIALAATVLLLGAYALAGFWGVPHFARSQLADFTRTHWQREVQVGEIHFNPFTLNLEVTQFALPDADGKTLIAFDHLAVDLQWASLWRRGPSFGSILLSKPYVRAVIRKDGELNLADLGKGFPAQPSKPPEERPEPLRLYIGRLAVTEGASDFEDRTHPTPFAAQFTPIAFELRDFSTVAGKGNDYHLDASSPQGARLDWTGTLELTPLSSRGAFQISEVKARELWSYVRDSVPFEITSGVLAVKGTYELATAGGPTSVKVDVQNSTLTQFGVRPKGAPQDYVDLARLEVTGTHVDVEHHSVQIEKVQLSGGDLKVWRDEQGRLNLLELAPPAAVGAPPQAAPAGAAAASPAAAARAQTSGANPAPWTVQAPDIALEGFKIAAEDRGVKPVFSTVIDPLNVHVAGFSSAGKDPLDITADSRINGTGRLQAKAKLTPSSGDLTAHVDAEAIGLTVLQPYLNTYTSMSLLKGALGAKLDLVHRADGYLSVRGNADVAGLKTVDNVQRRNFISWKALKVTDIDYKSAPQSLRIGNVTAVEPYARLIIFPDQVMNVTEVLTPYGTKPKHEAPPPPGKPGAVPAAAQTTPPAPKRKGAKPNTAVVAAKSPTPFPVSVGTVRLVNADLDYTDLWIQPSFSVGIKPLNGTITGLSSDPKSRAKIRLDGQVERYSPAHIAGEANLLSADLYTDITMSFKDIDLTIVNPYSGRFIGYKIDKGKLSVDVTYVVEDRKLDAKQHFVVDQLELGDKVDSPDAVHLPMKLAVSLLKDKDGVIDLDLPMNGSLDDPKFRIGPIIWKVFVNLIVKVVTAPFALLGHLFGGGEHVNIIEFPAGSAELDKPSKDQLASIAKGLKERPNLKLDVPIVYSAGLDRAQLAEARVHAQLAARVANTRQGRKHPDTALEMALADPKEHFQLLLEQYKEAAGKEAALPGAAAALLAAKQKEPADYDPAIAELTQALAATVVVPEDDLVNLGKERAKAIQDALLSDGQIDPGRVFIVGGTPKPDDGPKVKVELALK
ncbi:MAG: DUF748 domain-containing protein [Proteobacteria bacterium]|nr:DUF748 domain-containing protein [Pseudomonadota bacterium]